MLHCNYFWFKMVTTILKIVYRKLSGKMDLERRRDAIVSAVVILKKCAPFVRLFTWRLGCLEVLENYLNQQKFSPMSMKNYKGFYISKLQLV